MWILTMTSRKPRDPRYPRGGGLVDCDVQRFSDVLRRVSEYVTSQDIRKNDVFFLFLIFSNIFSVDGYIIKQKTMYSKEAGDQLYYSD